MSETSSESATVDRYRRWDGVPRIRRLPRGQGYLVQSTKGAFTGSKETMVALVKAINEGADIADWEQHRLDSKVYG